MRTVALTLLLVLTGPAQAQTQRNVAIVLDVSGSMQGGRLAQAVAGAVELVTSATDDLHARLITFDDEARSVTGWVRLPCARSADHLINVLHQLSARGDTDPRDAMARAIMEDRDPLTVLVLTDGDFTPQSNEVVDALLEALAARDAAGLAPVQIVFAVMGRSERGREKVLEVADRIGAAVWIEVSRPRAKTPPRAD